MTQPQSNTLTVTTPSDLEIVMTREFDAPRRLVFEAWTKPEHVARWFGLRNEKTEAEIDLRVGGSYRFILGDGAGGEMAIQGEYLEIAPPDRLVCTERFEGQFFEMMGAGTVNTMVLEDRDGRTLMTLLALYKSKEARDTALQTGMEEGAGISFDRLAELLETLVQESGRS
jgi:uncharacterized protein YndB with AHSA1/START domain